MTKEILITKPNGLKAEDCALIAHASSGFKSQVFIIKGSKKVNAKSVIGIISLNIKHGETIYLTVSGEDEDIASKKLLELIN